MTRLMLPAALSLGVLGLCGCSEHHSLAANPKICFTFTQTKPATGPAPDDPSAPVDNCARRWAYSLAPSHDVADEVAEAVVAACNAQLTNWNRQSLGGPAGDGPAESLTTGAPTSPIQEHMGFIHNRALLYVVQARAGGCAPPPAANGVPDGVN